MGDFKFYAGLLFACAVAETGYNHAMDELGYASGAEKIQYEPVETECLVGSEHGCLRYKNDTLEMIIPE